MTAQLMRLVVPTVGESAYLIKNGPNWGLTWMEDELDVINFLSEHDAVTANVDYDELNEIQKKYFDILWYDEGSCKDIGAAFDKLFDDCKGPLN